MRTGRAGPTRRGLLILALFVALCVGAFLVFQPSAALPIRAVLKTHYFLLAHGAPRWAAKAAVWEFVYNVALFVPPFFVLLLLWPRVRVLWWALGGLGVSTLIEITQAFFLHGRDAQVRDVVANTLGALIGASLGRAGDMKAKERRAS